MTKDLGMQSSSAESFENGAVYELRQVVLRSGSSAESFENGAVYELRQVVLRNNMR